MSGETSTSGVAGMNASGGDMGVVLIAIERPFYGRLAYNMALSIKLDAPEVPILLLADEAAMEDLGDVRRRVFDIHRVPSPADYRQEGWANPYRLKTRLYDYSPFQTTLYLDADGIFFNAYRSFRELLEELSGCDFQLQEEFRYGSEYRRRPVQYPWAGLDELWTVYGFGDGAVFVDYNSSFLWFRRNEANRRYFDAVKEIYESPRVEVSPIGKFLPDELAFSVASVLLGHEGCVEGYRPIYLQNYSERHPRRAEGRTFAEFASDEEVREVIRSHHFLGLPAIPPTSSVMALYNHLAKANARSAGDPQAFTFDWREKLISGTVGVPRRGAVED